MGSGGREDGAVVGDDPGHEVAACGEPEVDVVETHIAPETAGCVTCLSWLVP